MAKEIRVDVKENKILEMDASLLSILISMRRLVSRLMNYLKKRQYFEKRLSVLSYRKISY